MAILRVYLSISTTTTSLRFYDALVARALPTQVKFGPIKMRTNLWMQAVNLYQYC